MMQTADVRSRDHLAKLQRLDFALYGRVVLERQVRSCVMIVVEVSLGLGKSAGPWSVPTDNSSTASMMFEMEGFDLETATVSQEGHLG